MGGATTRPEDALGAAIAATGARFAFGMPGGGSNLRCIGGLERHGVRFVLAHGETSACIMAATYGHVSGTVSAAVVTRGPGAASAVNGLAQATLDRQPLVLVSDTVAAADRARVAHQRIDQTRMLGAVAKASTCLGEDTAADAVALAATWPAGGVHLDQDPTAAAAEPIIVPAPVAPSGVEEVSAAVGAARRPVVIVGAAAIGAARAIGAAIERFGAPTLTTYQAVGVVSTSSPCNAGLFTGGAPERALLASADLVVLVGVDMVEPIPAPWPEGAAVVSLAPVPTVERYAPIDVEAVGPLSELADRCLAGDHDWPAAAATEHRCRTLAALHEHPSGGFGPLDVVDGTLAWASEQGALTTTVDAGAHFLAVMPKWEVGEAKRLLISNGLATMGYAVPAAIGAALARPGERVLALTGDGGLGMTLAELETIARFDLDVVVVVFNDAELSLIRIKQLEGQGGPGAVRYRPTDFAAVAEAHGMPGRRVDDAAALAAALDGHSGGPLLVDARVDPSAYPHLLRCTRG